MTRTDRQTDGFSALYSRYNQQVTVNAGCACRDKQRNWSTCVSILRQMAELEKPNIVSFEAINDMDCDRIGKQFPCVLYSIILQRKIRFSI